MRPARRPGPRLLLLAGVLLAVGPLVAGAAPAAPETRLEVRISGLSGELLENVRATLGLWREREDPRLTPGRIRRLLRRAPAEVRRALEPFGRYRPTVHARLERRDGGWLAEIRVDPGPPVRVALLELELEGEAREDPAFRPLLERFPLRPGAVLDHRRWEEAKEAFQRLAQRRGYFRFRLAEHRVAVDPEAGTAAVRLVMHSGPRYRFGTVRFHQRRGDPLDAALLRRYLPFHPGEPYDAEALLALQGALLDSGLFADVEVRPLPEEAEGLRVPVEVALRPRPKYRYSARLGFGTDTGPRLGLGWENRRVNARGHRARAELRSSQVQDSLALSYTLPLRDPRSDQARVLARWLNDHPGTSRSRSLELALSRTLARGSGWVETDTLRYLREAFQVGDQSGLSHLVLPETAWERVAADDRLDPDRGYRVLLELRGTHRGLGSTAQFLQGRVFLKGALRLSRRARVLARAEAGATRLGRLGNLPASVRFFAGGDESVRGYAYRSLAPRNATGQVVGGSRLLTLSVEYEHHLLTHPVLGTWRVALFWDAGNALDRWQGSLAQGAGVGLRWLSPVGPVRLDLARALSLPGRSWRLHLTMGPDL